MKKRILLIFSISFIFVCSCTKSIYSSLRIQKGVYMKIEYGDNIVSIDSHDTATINKYSLNENFIVTDIKKEKGFYNIIIKSDLMQTFLNPNTNTKDSFYAHYQIISLKTKKIKRYEEIKKGQQYTLALTPHFYPNSNTTIGDEIYTVVFIFTKGMRVPVVKTALDIYTTPNLEGLYYIPCFEL